MSPVIKSRFYAPLALGGSLALAGAAGYLASQAFSAAPAPAITTVTVDVATGPQGATGPAGPPGTDGGTICPAGFVAGHLVINAPKGQTTIYTCIKT